MSKQQRFRATLAEADGGGHRFDCPFDAKSTFGSARPPITVTVNGHTYRSRLLAYGGRSYIGIRNADIAAAGLSVGQSAELVVSLDEAPRVVNVPAELEAA